MLSRHTHCACATPHTAMCSKGAPRRPAMRAAPALTNRPHSRFVRSGLSSHSGPARACVRLRPSPRPVTCPVAFRPSGEDSPPRASRVAHDVHGPHDPTVVPTLVGPARAVALRVHTLCTTWFTSTRSSPFAGLPSPRGSLALAASFVPSGSAPPPWGPLGCSSAAGTSVPSPSHWSDHPSGLSSSATPGGHALERWQIWQAHPRSARTCRFQHVCAVCSQMLHREKSKIQPPFISRPIFTRRSGSPLNFAAPCCSRLAHAAS